MTPVTIIMTSCDRWDLFQITLDSFLRLNTYPYVAFHVHNDSVLPIPQAIKDKYAGNSITWHEGVKRGLSASWDYLISLVQTEYFFNLEDDWLFEGNPNFIAESIKIIEHGYYQQVWIRKHKDHTHKLSDAIEYYPVEHIPVEPNRDWCGFTFNPALRKKSLWQTWFPDGISGTDEIDLSRKLYHLQFRACTLANSACKHIGWNRHSKNFAI